MKRILTPAQQVAQDIMTTRRKALWRPFMRAIRRYALISPGDRIAVCISGGKDSMLLAVMMMALQAHGDVPFEAVYLVMDPGYSPENRQKVEANARKLGIPYTLVESDVFEASAIQDRHPCFMCARMRRGCLYRHAQALGCNKIALGHHFDDVIETTLMAMLYGGQVQAMPPKLWADHFPGMALIRPLYMVRERDIIDWRDRWGLEFLQCACRLTEGTGAGRIDSKRAAVKRLIAELDADNPKVSANIFNSIHTVQMDTLVGWKHRGKEHSFLEDFNADAPEGGEN